MDQKELLKLIKLAKKHGIISLKYEGVELAFSPQALVPRQYKNKADEIKESREDVNKALFWSVPDLDPMGDAG